MHTEASLDRKTGALTLKAHSWTSDNTGFHGVANVALYDKDKMLSGHRLI